MNSLEKEFGIREPERGPKQKKNLA